MKKNIGVKTALYPMPVFIIGTYDDSETNRSERSEATARKHGFEIIEGED